MLARCYRPYKGFAFWSLYQVKPVPNKVHNDFVVTDRDGSSIVMHEDEFNKHFRPLRIKEKRTKLWDDVRNLIRI